MKVINSYWSTPSRSWLCTCVSGDHLGLCTCAVASVRCSLESVHWYCGQCPVFTWVCAYVLWSVSGVHLSLCNGAVASVRCSLGSVPLCWGQCHTSVTIF